MNPEPVSTNGPTITSPVVMGGEAPTVTSPVTTTNPEAPVVDAPVVADPAPEVVADPAVATDPDPATAAPKTTPEWAQKRINELTAKRYEAERTAVAEKTAREAAEARSAELLAQLANKDPNTPVPTNTSTAPVVTEAQIEERVAARAAQMAAANEFNKACNNIAEDGKKEYKEGWDESLKNLGLVGAVGQNVSPEFLETAIELRNPHKVLHYLGQNLEEAERLIKLSPKKMALEMARVEAQLNTPPPPAPVIPLSNAPAPVIPIAGAAKTGGLVDITDAAAPMDDWMAARQKQIDERRKRYQRV